VKCYQNINCIVVLQITESGPEVIAISDIPILLVEEMLISHNNSSLLDESTLGRDLDTLIRETENSR